MAYEPDDAIIYLSHWGGFPIAALDDLPPATRPYLRVLYPGNLALSNDLTRFLEQWSLA